MPPEREKTAEGSATSSRPKRGASPRDRLLEAGKTLFAENGYEATSTSSIASMAGTSESQLMRYFGGKAGLLEEIFNSGWIQLNERIGTRVVAASTGREAILVILQSMWTAFHSDDELAKIFLFEGRRIRGAEHEVFISEGFVRFRELIHQLIRRGVADGSFRKDLPEAALVSALIGCAEGMIRDRLVAKRTGKLEAFSAEDIQIVVSAILEGL